MTRPVISEYDPATGQEVITELPDDLFEAVTGQTAGTAFPSSKVGVRRLSELGKGKLRRFAIAANSSAERAVIDHAADTGEISSDVALRFGLVGGDFLASAADPAPNLSSATPSSASTVPSIPRLAARKLNESGKGKLRVRAIAATSLEELADIEVAVGTGDITADVALRLGLTDGDFIASAISAHSSARLLAAPVSIASTVPGRAKLASRSLSESGKNKLRCYVTTTTSADELTEIEQALDRGLISEALIAKLQLAGSDFEVQPPLGAGSPPSAPLTSNQTSAATPPPQAPLGALGLTPLGLQKVRRAIQVATDLDLLATLDTALTQGDIPRLRQLLDLLPEDLQRLDDEVEREAESDPYTLAPDAMGSLQTAYDASDDEKGTKKGKSKTDASVEPTAGEGPVTKKRKKGEKKTKKPKTLAWPLEWAWLVSRTQRHPDFRQPTLFPDSRWAPELPPDAKVTSKQMLVAVATSVIYAGDASSGYDPRHLARISAIDEHGQVLLDTTVKPRCAVLDYRTHLTGLRQESFDGAPDFTTAVSQLLELLHSKTLLVGHRLSNDLEAMKLYHGTLVDVSLLFSVETRKQHQFHPLRFLAEHVLGEKVDEDSPYDALEGAQLMLRLAKHEAKQTVPTPPFPPKAGNTCELAVKHIPVEWRKEISSRIANLVPTANRKFSVHWLLSEADPTDWRGETALTFETSIARDAAFEALRGLTDIHVQWDDLQGAPPLGAFMTEQNLIKAFSQFGVVVSARVPRKPTTREPQSFAFISFLNREDAERVAKQQSIEVELGPGWMLPLRPRLAKFGQSTDKRIAVHLSSGDDDFAPFDWVHVFRK